MKLRNTTGDDLWGSMLLSPVGSIPGRQNPFLVGQNLYKSLIYDRFNLNLPLGSGITLWRLDEGRTKFGVKLRNTTGLFYGGQYLL
jgi:hypothetical protein